MLLYFVLDHPLPASTSIYQHAYYVQFTVDLTVIPFVLPSLQLLIHSLASLAPSAAFTTTVTLSGSKFKCRRMHIPTISN